MYNNDYILRQIELLGQGARVLLGKQEAGDEEAVITEDGILSGEIFLLHRLRLLVHEGKIGEAEDLLFENLERDRGGACFGAARTFYEELQALSDEELEAGGFSREEIAEGLDDVRRLRETEDI